MARPARSIYEERIDFERIEAMRDAREASTLKELRTQLFRMQNVVLKFVDEELVSKKLKSPANRFTMPMVSKYREIVRRRLTEAYIHGSNDVATELQASKKRITKPEQNKIRRNADALTTAHMNELEGKLKVEWSKNIEPPIDRSQMRYVTKKVFADFAGWEQPEPE